LALACAAPAAFAAAGPANPKASADARRIYAYFQSLPGRADARVVSGQFTQWGNSAATGYKQGIADLQASTGKWVGLAGFDWRGGVDLKTPSDWWKAGGLVTVSYHWDNPFTGGNAWDAGGDLKELLKDGSPAQQRFTGYLDQTAASLRTLKDQGVVVLWRPLHENNGNWFWWGAKDSAAFIAIWRKMFTYFTETKGLDNLLWVYAPNYGNNVARNYPGDAYVDIVGLDAYFDRPSAFTLTGYAEMAKLGKPLGLTEFGGVPAAGGQNFTFDNTVLIKEIKAKYPKICFFMNWHCPWSIACQNNAAGLLKDPWVANRDDLAWKSLDPTPVRRPLGTVSFAAGDPAALYFTALGRRLPRGETRSAAGFPAPRP
jgi:mannan endo-1,4-beta-mannosidase